MLIIMILNFSVTGLIHFLWGWRLFRSLLITED